jgi:hypothetical protein
MASRKVPNSQLMSGLHNAWVVAAFGIKLVDDDRIEELSDGNL